MSNPRQTEFKKFSWYNLTDNSDQETRFLRDHFNFSKSFLLDVATPPLRPKVEFSDAEKLSSGTIKITKKQIFVYTGNGILELIEVQPPGKARMPAQSFLAGHKNLLEDNLFD